MEQEHLQLRKHIEEISKLTEEEWEFIASHFHLRRLKKHHFLVQEGQKVDHEFWIVKGLVKSYAIDAKGKEHIMQFGMENYWVSDYPAFQFKREATMNVDCLEDSVFFSLSFNDRETICHQVPAMANFFRTKSNLGYINLQQRIMSLLTQTAEERYEEILQKMPHLIQRVPKRLLASFLGVSRETLSRL
ncbi:Crp/Fnr family transcriptional regulator [uncultured Roseivirga sp.]|uniref:Crp/Fnr family transcriptional regulator n=1 Tax=uncultured Roseivirga sp. TaxID=543088 RepID=UPI000D7AC070|nr:Crp/Fnr family transcriptional regulator [uncultured Roseivirga sp.]PWL32281.1 MAG: Crp/Fnr family transcriptional regulator [Roseivirga sp. XM-24bin3]